MNLKEHSVIQTFAVVDFGRSKSYLLLLNFDLKTTNANHNLKQMTFVFVFCLLYNKGYLWHKEPPEIKEPPELNEVWVYQTRTPTRPGWLTRSSDFVPRRTEYFSTSVSRSAGFMLLRTSTAAVSNPHTSERKGKAWLNSQQCQHSVI